eukprot:c23625_g1_i1.p1 GENE.c23625_g1_i1~~c23625_g1_i1.p1  ORF type:complete len:462 (+),score=89.06 c23625_g1_i1:59-1387(+)
MMGEGWTQLQRTLQQPVVYAESVSAVYTATDLPVTAVLADTSTNLTPGFVWQTKARVKEMKELCGHTFYVLQADVIRPDMDEQIRKDVPRTFPHSSLFFVGDSGKWGPAHHNLYRILRAYAAMDPQVGYCQGMNFLAAMPLFHMMPDDGFWVFFHLMQELSWREYFLKGFPKLRQSLFILDRLLEIHLPKVAAHLQEQNVHITTFTTQWFLTAFTYNLALPSAVRVWNMIFAEGHDYAYAVAIVIFQRYAQQIISKTNSVALQEFLLTFSKDMHLSPNEILQASQIFHNSLKPSLATINANAVALSAASTAAVGGSSKSTPSLSSRLTITNIKNAINSLFDRSNSSKPPPPSMFPPSPSPSPSPQSAKAPSTTIAISPPQTPPSNSLYGLTPPSSVSSASTPSPPSNSLYESIGNVEPIPAPKLRTTLAPGIVVPAGWDTLS